MKKICVCLLALDLLAILFFTVYGDALYEMGKPTVTVSGALIDKRNACIYIPSEAIRSDSEGDYIYVLHREPAYGRTIYSVKRVLAPLVEYDTERNQAKLPMITSITVILTESKPIRDGDRVVWDGERPLALPWWR